MATNVFELYAKIGADTKDFDKGLSSAKDKFSGFADGLKSAAGKVGDILAGIGKAAAVGIGAASTALVGLTKQSLDAVANFEQLEGGVKKIFGEESAKKVMDFANNAYATAGMSANQYMETVTNFSATLIAGLKGDTEKAADLANMAIEDMADNANTFGTDLDSVQAAYQAFAKQNYTLLDNLKLGYGGTAREMARLLNESGVLGDRLINLDDTKGLTEAISEAGFPKIIEAIHKVQQELNITGTTGDEAGRTISGSVASMKAAWQNFLTGTGSPKQFTEVLSVSIENIKKNLNQIIPRLTSGLTELVDLLAPEIPPIIEETLPTIIDGASKLLTGLASRLPELLTAILPSLATGVVNITVELVKVMPKLIDSLKKSIPIIVETIMSKKDELLTAGKDIIKAIIPSDFSGVAGITQKAASLVGDLVMKLTDPANIAKVVDVSDAIVGGIIDGLINPDALSDFLNPDGEHSLAKLIDNIAEGIKTILLGSEQDGEGGLFGAAKKIVESIGDYFADDKNRENFKETAWKCLKSLGEGLKKILEQGVAPLLVEIARMYMELFVGDIDYDDAASEILARLGKAFVNNMATGGVLGLALDKHAEPHMEEIEEAIEEEKGRPQEWYTAKGMIQDTTGQIPWYAKERMKEAMGYASGFVVDRPTWLGGNTLVGEAGTEALIPLESNTQWMDTFADKLGARMGGGGVVIEQMIINAPSGNAEDIQAAFLDNLDEALRNRQITQNRGVGAVVWK